ncbi:hypothetical protein F4861DRAFT_522018 [Xylaria intraflava]|nr:hypothetical protein F4861DRAFT_522018 [Xylaria intraflava]
METSIKRQKNDGLLLSTNHTSTSNRNTTTSISSFLSQATLPAKTANSAPLVLSNFLLFILYAITEKQYLKMQFRAVSLLFIAATGIAASPLSGADYSDLSDSNQFEPETAAEIWHLLETSERENGSRMEYYGVHPSNETLEARSPEPTRTVDIDRRATKCSANPTPSCDLHKNQAQNQLCSSLLDELNAQYDIAIATNWRQICFKGQSGSCCTGWNTAVPGLIQGDLTNNIQTLSEHCSSNGISGKIYGTKLYNTCCNQCLNSGHGCA